MNNEWYTVENLKKSYQEQIKKYEEGFVDSRGDFGSYLNMLNNGTDDLIQSHNATGIGAEIKAKIIIRYLKDIKASMNTIADMGGGCGFIANKLHQVCPEALIFSYELSEAAVTYAKQHFKDIEFIEKAIDIDEHFSEGPFDVIVCHEFYPFTRNNDVEYQIAYIDTFLNNLTAKGVLMINCLESPQSLISILGQVKQNLKDRGYSVKKKLFPAVKIHAVVHNFRLSVALTRILARVLRKKVIYSVIIQKNNVGYKERM